MNFYSSIFVQQGVKEIAAADCALSLVYYCFLALYQEPIGGFMNSSLVLELISCITQSIYALDNHGDITSLTPTSILTLVLFYQKYQ